MKDNEDSLKIIVKGAIILLVGAVISKILTYFYRLIVARIGTSEYGIISLAITITTMLSLIATFGMGEGVSRFIPYYNEKKEKEKVRGIINYSLILTTSIALALSALLFIFSDFIAMNFFHEEKLGIILKITSLMVPLNTLFDILVNIIRSFKKVKYEVYIKNIAGNLLKIIFTLILLSIGYGLLGVAIALPLATIITVVFLFYVINKKIFKIFNNKAEAKYQNKELFFYSLPLVFNTVAYLIMSWIDIILIGYFKTTSDVGIYNAAIPTAQLIFIVPNALLVLFMPVLTGLYAAKNNERFNSLYKTITRWMFMFCAISASFFIIFGRKFLSIFFGNEYASGATALAIISVAYLIFYTTLSSNRILLILKKTKLILINTIAGAIVNIILNIYLIPKYGINGAAIATGISLILIAVLQLTETVIIKRIMPVNSKYINIILSVLITSMIISSIKDYVTNLISLLLIGGLMMLIFIFLLFVTKSFTKDDRKIINYLKNKINV